VLDTPDPTRKILVACAIAVLPGYWLLELLAESPNAMLVFIGVAAAMLGMLMAGRLRLPSPAQLLANLGSLGSVATLVGVVVARRPYETFSRALHTTPELLGFDWHHVAVVEAALLLTWLAVFLLLGLGVLIVFESQASECRAGHVLRWRRAGQVALILMLAIGWTNLWVDAGRAGSDAAAEVIRTGQAPHGSRWLRGLDVMAVRLAPPGPDPCPTPSPGSTPPALMLGRDGDELQLLVRGQDDDLRRERRSVGSVVLCESSPLAPHPERP